MAGRDLLAVVVGGAIGSAMRLGIDTGIPHADNEFPLSTLVINTIGAFALGVLVARVWPVAPTWLRAGLGVGLLGTFTTFSAVTVSLVALAEANEWMPALGFLALTLVLGLGAAALGLGLGRPTPTPDWSDE